MGWGPGTHPRSLAARRFSKGTFFYNLGWWWWCKGWGWGPGTHPRNLAARRFSKRPISDDLSASHSVAGTCGGGQGWGGYWVAEVGVAMFGGNQEWPGNSVPCRCHNPRPHPPHLTTTQPPIPTHYHYPYLNQSPHSLLHTPLVQHIGPIHRLELHVLNYYYHNPMRYFWLPSPRAPC